MTNTQAPVDHKAHLKVALIFLGAWLFIVYVLFKNIHELGGLHGLLNEIRGGEFSDLLLVAFSIFLLAKGLYHLFKYRSLKNQD